MNTVQKLKSNSGMTLAETLLAVLILLMVSSIVATGIPVAQNAYEKVILSSNAEMLLSTSLTALRGELSTAKHIRLNSSSRATSIEFVRAEDSLKYTLKNYTTEESNTPEGIYLFYNATDDDATTYSRRLVSKASSTAASHGDLYVTFDYVNISTSGNSKYLTFHNIQVKHHGSDKSLTSVDDFSVRIIAD